MKRNLIALTQDMIDAAFEAAKDQQDYLLALYRIALPDFDLLLDVGGFPACHDDTSHYIAAKAMEFDRAHHPNCLPGGAWLNYGFSANNSVPPWKIDVSRCRLVYQTTTPSPRQEKETVCDR